MRIRKVHWGLWMLLVLVYLVAFFMPLMENDSAQFAVMAMQMAQDNDYLHLYKNGLDYLDKPHMHYWLAAFSFELFGVSAWAYRLPAMLSLVLAAYAMFRLGTLLRDSDFGRVAAFVFLSTQTMLLAAFDLRTDTLLVSFVTLSLWKLIAYVKSERLIDLILATMGAAVAFSTKGMLALVVIAISFLSYLYLHRAWKVLWSYHLPVAIFIFFISIAPVLYAYYVQFDLHPEKVIRGVSERSGVRFILWDQSFERLSGTGHGKNSNGFFFFFHTLLWIVLPYTFYFLSQSFRFSFNAVSFRRKPAGFAFLALFFLLLLMSFSQFKLPHYLNVLMPLIALIIAQGLFEGMTHKTRRWMRFSNGLLLALYGVVTLALFLVFSPDFWPLLIIVISWTLTVYLYMRRTFNQLALVIAVSFTFNLLSLIHFYPQLLQFQSGTQLYKHIPASGVVYNYSDDYTWVLDFKRKKLTIPLKEDALKRLPKGSFVYVDQKHLPLFKHYFPEAIEYASSAHFRVTRLNLNFLNPATRADELQVKRIMYLP